MINISNIMGDNININVRPALNQLYKEIVTKNTYPLVDRIYNEIKDRSIEKNFYKSNGNVRGRIYDDAVLYTAVIEDGGTFEGKMICDLGARDGAFGAWLTREAEHVYVSDYFNEWGKGTEYDLGQIDIWTQLWQSIAPNPDRLTCEHQDMTKLTYADNTFDHTISTSVIEHIHNQVEYRGDMVAIREMVRVTKPGGYILLSTDMTAGPSKWHSGTFYYNEVDLYDRIINPSKCAVVGSIDFTFGSENNTDENIRDVVGTVSSVTLILKKPL